MDFWTLLTWGTNLFSRHSMMRKLLLGVLCAELIWLYGVRRAMMLIGARVNWHGVAETEVMDMFFATRPEQGLL